MQDAGPAVTRLGRCRPSSAPPLYFGARPRSIALRKFSPSLDFLRDRFLWIATRSPHLDFQTACVTRASRRAAVLFAASRLCWMMRLTRAKRSPASPTHLPEHRPVYSG